jgi:hypothetical protein
MVATDEVRADLYGIVAISDFSDLASDDLALAEQALLCDCPGCVAVLDLHQRDVSSTTLQIAPEGCS